MSKHNKTALLFLSILIILVVLNFFTTIGFTYFIVVAVSWFLVVLLGSAFINSNYHVKAHCSNAVETQKNIAITFDDGPHPMTLLVLEVLKKHQAKATFFCIGSQIEKHPKILQRIIDEGHLVGNHSYSHSPFFDFYKTHQVLQELKATDDLIEKNTGKKPHWFRPPFGITNPSIAKAIAQTKHQVIGWNIRSLDGVIKNKNIIFNRIANRIAPGGIVLLHDTSSHTVVVLERLLVRLREKNYQVVSLEVLLDMKAYEN